jgi:hypothetical protein
MAAAVREDAALVASGARDSLGTLGDYEWVPEYFASMAGLYQQLGHRRGQALCLCSLAALAEYQGQYAEALSHAEQAATLFRGLGDKTGEAELLSWVGWYHALLGTTGKRAGCAGGRSPSTPATAAATWKATSGTAWATPNTTPAHSARRPPAMSAR